VTARASDRNQQSIDAARDYDSIRDLGKARARPQVGVRQAIGNDAAE
jgi:hypothetical protein